MLTDIAVRNAKPRERPYKLGDAGAGRSLPLPAVSCGASSTASRESQTSCRSATTPTGGLKAARAKRDEAASKLAAGVDPSAASKAAKAARDGADSFEALAREWHATKATGWAPGHADKIMGRLERHIFPWLGARPVGEITPAQLLAVLRRIEARGTLS